MKAIITYIRQYFTTTNKTVLGLTTLFIGLIIFLNYYFKIDIAISKHYSFAYSFTARWIIFAVAFIFPYFLYVLINHRDYFKHRVLLLLLGIAPAIFSLKIALDIPLSISTDPVWNTYWNDVFYWPFRLVILVLLLLIIWRSLDKDQPFYGVTTRNLIWKPYIIMLLIMLPLIAAASTQPDFLHMYPKLKMISAAGSQTDFTWWHKLLFELSYGSDFIGIELFFRGFLILAFIKWAGKDAILPMACFYCTIHFGKPLGECISSYFGGLILGVVVYNTGSIFGGLMVHLGIAWLMEIGGYIGNSF